jgi:hypothetical protein
MVKFERHIDPLDAMHIGKHYMNPEKGNIFSVYNLATNQYIKVRAIGEICEKTLEVNGRYEYRKVVLTDYKNGNKNYHGWWVSFDPNINRWVVFE